MNNQDIESAAKVIFFNPEVSVDVIDYINRKGIFIDRKIEEMISSHKTHLLAEMDDPRKFGAIEENIAMLENLLNLLKQSHL